MSTQPPIDYKSAGVDIDAGNRLVDRIKPLAKATHRPELQSTIGGFAGAFAIPKGYTNPLMVACTDGVGTKLELANSLNQHHTIGIDLVAMCVNDLICCGAEPLFFLDYLATGKLDVAQAEQVISGIAQGCQQANVSLLGGETAEMPGFYAPKQYDLAGFSVGIVEHDEQITGQQVKPSDVAIGLASSGVHSNGYSLVRKIIDTHQLTLDAPFATSTLGETLLTPTAIYVKPILSLLKNISVKAISHITGGGFIENLPRILPDGLSIHIDQSSWQRPEIFNWIQHYAQLDETAMFTTFNMGIGLVLIVDSNDAKACIAHLHSLNQPAVPIGQIHGQTQQKVVFS